jgi:hypothetical protein
MKSRYIKILGIVSLAGLGAFLGQVEDVDAAVCAAQTFQVKGGTGGLQCCRPPNLGIQACGSVNRDLDTFISGCGTGTNNHISGSDRFMTATLMTNGARIARITCGDGSIGQGTSSAILEDLFSLSDPTRPSRRCDHNAGCAGAVNWRFATFQ